MTPEAALLRERMLHEIEARGVRDPRVLQALRRVPRHEFVPDLFRDEAYDDRPLPIGHGQTISQPYVVAFMTEVLGLLPGDKVLEVGTGSGYQTAILAALEARVYSIEIVEDLVLRAQQNLERAGVHGVHVRQGDAFHGWVEAAPFDAILVAAAPLRVPRALLEQLRVGGRLIVPVGEVDEQALEMHERTPGGFKVSKLLPVRFVPMTGLAETERLH